MLDNFCSIAALLQHKASSITAASLVQYWSAKVVVQVTSRTAHLRKRDEDTTAIFDSCWVVSGARVTAL